MDIADHFPAFHKIYKIHVQMSGKFFNCFIENKGQFIKEAKQLGEVKYVLGESDQVLFTNKGFCFRVIERKEVYFKREKESEEREREEEREKNEPAEYCNVFFQFENANTNCQLIASKKRSDYFTYLSSINDSIFGIILNTPIEPVIVDSLANTLLALHAM